MRHTRLILAALLALGPLAANADFIGGEISMTGGFVPTGDVAGLADATGLDFRTDSTDDKFWVTAVTGDFALAGIMDGDMGDITDFLFNPLLAPVSPLWSIAGFTFDLQAISIDYQTSSFLLLSGTGFLSHADFDNTVGSWSLSAQGGQTTFSFSSTTVPEPSTLALLGLGLLGLGLSRRRKKI